MKMTTICAFCLSNDRILTIIDEKYRKVVDFCINSSEEEDEIEYLQCLQRKQALEICWECSSKLQNFHQFISTSQQCVRVLNTYLEASIQTLPPSTSKLYITKIEIVDTGPTYEETHTDDMADTIDAGLIYEETKTEVLTDTETEDMADTVDTETIYEDPEMENMAETFDVKMENDPLETELNDIPDNKNGEVINSDIREDPCTSVDLEMIKEQVVWWRVILQRLPTVTLPANISSSDAPVTICDGTNYSRIEATEHVPRVEALHEVTDCISKQQTTKENEENISKKDKVNIKTITLKRVSLTYICDHCKQKFITKMKLRQHISIHYGVSEVNLTCQTCNYKGFSVQALEKHSRLHDEKRRFKCNSCTYRFNSNRILMQHVQTHTREKQYKCDLCDYMSSRSNDLKSHMGIHTEEKQYKCDLCDYVSSQSCKLKSHMRIHTGEKPYKCDLCDYVSSRSVDLKSHMRIHTGEKPYKCDLCDYVSSRSGALKSHMRIHTGEKQYKCDLCDYASSQSCKLKRHMTIHTGEKPYKCDLCDFASSRSGNLKTHMRIHTGEKPYKCDLCEYRCIQSEYLSKHKKRRHAASSAT